MTTSEDDTMTEQDKSDLRFAAMQARRSLDALDRDDITYRHRPTDLFDCDGCCNVVTADSTRQGGVRICDECGSDILCGACRAPWTDDHDCDTPENDNSYAWQVTVTATSRSEALAVMQDRLDGERELGFNYTIQYDEMA